MTEPRYFSQCNTFRDGVNPEPAIIDLRGDETEMNL
jgi:hypothetical protein